MTRVAKTLRRYFKCRADHGTILKIEEGWNGNSQSVSSLFGGFCPFELLDLYHLCNGFAIVESDEEVNWMLPKLENLGKFMIDSKVFYRTHGILSEHYYPVFSFDGNTLGYMGVESGGLDDSLYMYDHEYYLGSEDQPWSEFLCRLDMNISEYFEHEMSFYK